MSFFSVDFISLYREVGRRYGRSGELHPAGDLRQWRDFTESCTAGYDDSLAEYRADLWIRNLIQVALECDGIRAVSGFFEFEAQVLAIDERFRGVATVVLPSLAGRRAAWWNEIVPGVGGSEFASDVFSEFGITIGVI